MRNPQGFLQRIIKLAPALLVVGSFITLPYSQACEPTRCASLEVCGQPAEVWCCGSFCKMYLVVEKSAHGYELGQVDESYACVSN